MEQRRVFSASDLAQFEYCSLSWWYEEVSDLAQADPEELAQRLEELEDEYPSSAKAQPEYLVIERLLERANRFARGRKEHASDAARRQTQQSASGTITTSVPPIFGVIVAGLVVLTVVLLGLGLLLWVQ